jgi:hypothetical protein
LVDFDLPRALPEDWFPEDWFPEDWFPEDFERFVWVVDGFSFVPTVAPSTMFPAATALPAAAVGLVAVLETGRLPASLPNLSLLDL